MYRTVEVVSRLFLWQSLLSQESQDFVQSRHLGLHLFKLLKVDGGEAKVANIPWCSRAGQHVADPLNIR